VKIQWLPVTVGVGPLLVSHVCHGVSAAAGLMPMCVPYLQGCLSMSAAARLPPANYLFDVLMIPAAVLLIIFWSRTRVWLAAIAVGPAGSIVAGLGVAGGCFMVVASVFLGAEEDYSRLLRRVGINGYVLFTVLAQVGLTTLLWSRSSRRLARALVAVCLVELLLAVLGVVEDVFEWRNNHIDNIIEWNFALFMSLFFVLLSGQWGNQAKPRSAFDRPPDHVQD
jgi:hypothetical protein